LGEISRSRHCSPATITHASPNQDIHTFTAITTSHQPHNLKQHLHDRKKTKHENELELPYLEEVSGDLDDTTSSTATLGMN